MKKSTRIVALASLPAILAMLMGCPPDPKKQAKTLQEEKQPIAAIESPKQQTAFPMEKPKVLGPKIPAIVVIPEQFAEPEIRVRVTGELDGPPALAGYKSKYRGTVHSVRLPNGKYAVINTLSMDSYLQGVLAKELYGGWNAETYKAQAIAARTYAVFQLVVTDAKTRAWDVNNDESSQVYGGIAGETAKSKAAVAATRGQILFAKYKGHEGVFCTFFSACAGPASQDPYEAWGDASVGPLSARNLGNIDAMIEGSKYSWGGLVISKSDVTRCVQSWGKRNDVAYLANIGPVVSVAVSKRNLSTNRPTEFAITDKLGKTVPIRAEEFRLSFIHDPSASAPKPLSSNFDVQDSGSSITLVNGFGFGHGIGLSQWGAEAMARRGSSYTQIIAYYYPGAIFKQAW
jgi:stage II sporulation protein D